jgi:acyl-CoA thioester hydrolase
MEPRYEHRLRVRFGECDPQGVVFNANYLLYFDVAYTELWRDAFGSWDVMVEQGVDLVVAEVRQRWRSPARFDEELDVGLTLTRLGKTAITTAFEMKAGERLVLEGEIRHVVIDPKDGAKIPMPGWLREGLEPYAEEAPASAEREG